MNSPVEMRRVMDVVDSVVVPYLEKWSVIEHINQFVTLVSCVELQEGCSRASAINLVRDYLESRNTYAKNKIVRDAVWKEIVNYT